ncbi:Two-pore potassium channel 1 [Spatholobus suberectus]|nr:Two-pore potassium channel 1 [Spatholobus suberectus]
MIAGTIFLYFVENLDFVDALYCVCSTVTTLGYGDKSFSTTIGRAFAVFWILSSTICLAQSFAYLAELYTEERQKSLVKMVLERKLSLFDLEAADLDGDHVVSATEFVLYKLKEMGKINQEDILIVMDIFRKLDFDKSGTLTKLISDILNHLNHRHAYCIMNFNLYFNICHRYHLLYTIAAFLRVPVGPVL